MIIPAILEKDFKKVKEEVKLVDSEAELIQIDIADGKFVYDKTFTEVEKLDEIETDAKFELHLMVENPLDYLKTRIDKVVKVSCHVEVPQAGEFLKKAREMGYEAGLSVNPGTSIESLAPFMRDLDFVQFMTVVPGKQGGDFIRSAIDNLDIFTQTAPSIPTQVDGGVDESNMADIVDAGATHIVIGSQIFQKPVESFNKFEELEKEMDEKEQYKTIIKTIGFFGGAAWDEGSEVYKDAFETAKLLAKEGYEIVNGGGPGVMRAATKGAHEGGSKLVLGITYHPNRPKKNYEGTDPLNDFEQEVVTLDYFDRTKVMLQNSDVHIVFKGGTGTISEFGMTWASSRIHEGHHKPIILFGKFWENIINVLKGNMLMRPGELDLIKIVETPEEALHHIQSLDIKRNPVKT